MKAVWSGSLSFGLVSIPIKLYSATSEHSLGFTLLCGKCKHPIEYERWCTGCKKEVPWTDVVKGLKLPTGKYLVLTPEKIATMRPEKTDTVDIVEFVEQKEIPLIYYKKHYYAIPSKTGEKPYFLFKKALEVSKKVAIGSFVMRDKQHVCAISPIEDALLLTTLHYDYEVRKLQKISVLQKVPKIATTELTLAKKLITQLTEKKFNITQFKDEFAANLLKAIKSGKGKKIALPKESGSKKRKKEETLIDALKASVSTKKSKKKS